MRAASGSLAADGNPLSEERATAGRLGRAACRVKPFTEGMEILYFVGCYYSYDPRMKKVAVATAKHPRRRPAWTSGSWAAKESCCGESIRKTGNEEVFKTLARENIKTFIDHGVKKILVSSPHCYHTFKNEYPEFMVNFEVVHISQFLAELIEQGRLELSGRVRQEGHLSRPLLPGPAQRHLRRSPGRSCRRCPGWSWSRCPTPARTASAAAAAAAGSGWTRPRSERFSDLRLAQAQEVGAEVLVTSCPYCISNFEESRLALEDDDALEIKDITEVIQEVARGKRRRRHERLADDNFGDVMVVGGGISGIQAALDLATSGYKVYLVEKAPTIGGKMAQLDKTFPTNDCSMCIESPKFIECDRHPNIEILTYTEVDTRRGRGRRLQVTLTKKPRYVNEDLCTGCTTCAEYCPVQIPDPFNQELSDNKAIHIYFSQAVPLVPYIDEQLPLSCKDEKCSICEGVCKNNAIDLHQKPEKQERQGRARSSCRPGYGVVRPHGAGRLRLRQRSRTW